MIPFPRVLPIIAYDHRRDVCTREFSGELEATQRCDDSPSVDQLVGSIEKLESVEEERPLLGIEQREPLVEQHLSHVGFDLGEIRIDRRVQAQVLANAPPHIATQLAFLLIVTSVAECGRAIRVRGESRCRFENQSALQIVQPVQTSRLREEVCIGAHRGSPGILKPGVLYAPEDVNPPALHLCVLVSKTLERYPHLDFIPTFDQAPFRLEEIIRIEVYAAFERIDVSKSAAGCLRTSGASRELRAPRSVLLNAVRIDAEEERDLA